MLNALFGGNVRSGRIVHNVVDGLHSVLLELLVGQINGDSIKNMISYFDDVSVVTTQWTDEHDVVLRHLCLAVLTYACNTLHTVNVCVTTMNRVIAHTTPLAVKLARFIILTHCFKNLETVS